MRGKMRVLFCMMSILMLLSACSKEKPGKVAETTEPVLEEPEYVLLEPTDSTITFNDGDLYTAHCMKEKDFENDESECRLSIAEFKGEKQLKIEVLDKGEDGFYKNPKIVFDVDRLVGSENLSRIKSFSADITQVAVGEFIGDDGEPMMVAGNLQGSFGSILGPECDEWYEPTGSANNFAGADWLFGWTHLSVEGKFLIKGYVDGTTDSTLVFMRWGIPNQADIYIDNLTFYDEDSNPVPILYKPGQPDEEPQTEQTAESQPEESAETN